MTGVITAPIVSVRAGPRATLTSALRTSSWKKVLPLRDRGRDFVLLLSIYSCTISLGRDLPQLSSRRRLPAVAEKNERRRSFETVSFRICTYAVPKLRVASCERLLRLKEMGPGRNTRMTSICLIQARSVSHNCPLTMMLNLWEITNCTQLVTIMRDIKRSSLDDQFYWSIFDILQYYWSSIWKLYWVFVCLKGAFILCKIIIQ